MVVDFIKKVQQYLTGSVSDEPDISYQESITRIILIFVGVVSAFFSLYVLIGYLVHRIGITEIAAILCVDAAVTLAFVLCKTGNWRAASLVPVLIFLVLGFYSIYTGFHQITGYLAFAFAILLAGFLSTTWVVVLVILVSVILNLVVMVLNDQTAGASMVNDVVSMLSIYIGMSYLQWLAVSQMQKAIANKQKTNQALQYEIDQHMNTQAELVNTLRNYQLTLQHVQNDIFRVRKDEDGNLVMIMSEGQMATRLGITTAETAGKKISEIMSAESYRMIYPQLFRAFAGGKVSYIGQLGSYYFLLNLTPIITDGMVTEVVGSLFNQTEEITRQKEILLFQQKMQFFIDHTPMGVVELDLEGRILSWNSSAERIFGYKKDTALGMQVADLLIPARQRQSFHYLFEGFIKQSGDGKVLMENMTAQGFPIQCEWVNSIIVDENGKSVGIMATIQEVTERIQSEAIQRTLYQISEAASTISNLPELYRSVHQIIGDLIQAKNFFIALHESESQVIRYVYFVDEKDESPVQRTFGNGLTEFVLLTGEPALVDPARFDELVAQGVVQNQGTPSVDWLGVPLKTQEGITFGVIAIQTYTEGERYNRSHLNIFNFVSTQVAAAILRVQDAEKLRESEEKYRTFLEQTNDAMMLIDQNGTIIEINRSLELLTGYGREEVIGIPAWEFSQILLPPEKKDELSPIRIKDMHQQAFWSNLNTDANVSYSIEIIRKDQTRRFVQESMFRINKGDSYHIGIITRDITEQKRAEDDLRKSEERYRSFLENQGEGSAYLDTNEVFVYANPAADSLFGCESGQLIGQGLFKFISPDQAEVVKEQTRLRQAGGKTTFEIEIHTPNKIQRTLLVTSTPQFNGDGVFLGSFSLFRDITERKRTEEQLRYFSMYDALTNIYNRAFFEMEISRLQGSELFPISIMVIDVDELKQVNDMLGHAVGDELLRQTASLLKKSVRQDDAVARIGGDEFAIIMPTTGEKTANDRLKHIRKCVEKYNEDHGQTEIHLSCGIFTGEFGADLSDVIKKADEKMFRDKAQKKRRRSSLLVEVKHEKKHRQG